MLRELPPEAHMPRLREILMGSPRATAAMRLLAQLEWNALDWCTAIQLLDRDEARRTFLVVTGLGRVQLAAKQVVRMAGLPRASQTGGPAQTTTDQGAQ